ncbi:MAG: hypothetical protein KKC37_16930, partial [Proteobacteria bacterium]|nr:hypothetical protein [Pseudomonadota bacterium]
MAVTEELGLRIVTEGLNKFMADMKGAESAVSGAATGMSKAGGIAEKAGAAFQTVGKVAFGAIVAGGALAVGAIGGVAASIIDLTLKAAPLEGIGASFDVMAAKFGVSLDTMRTASGGAVSDFELMRMANVALTGAGEDFGKEFGEKLPDLLEFARASARATGQDVGFLFNSLVTGIKRGSPLLIDNTGLVLKEGEANEAMAKSLGKTVEELTAEEKQIALLNATVDAGNAMVEQYGSAQDSAAMQIASFKTSIQNAKDEIGIAFLPVLQMVMEPLKELANAVIPVVVDAIQNFATHFGTLVSMLQEGIAPMDAIGFFLVRMGVPPETVQSIKDFAAGIQEFIAQAIVAIEPIAKWISENVKLQDVLIVLGAAIASVIIPAIAGFIAAVAPVVAVVIGAIAIVAALRAAWESDFMGIQTITTSIFENIKGYITTALGALQAFWQEHGTAIMAIATTAWEGIKNIVTTVSDAIIAAWGAYTTTAQTLTETAWDAIKSAIDAALVV